MRKDKLDAILFYKANFSEVDLAKIEKNIDFESFKNPTKAFIELAINFAVKMKADITIKYLGCTLVELYIQIGTFFDSFKDMFLALATLSDEVLIMPINDDSKFTLKISLKKDSIPLNGMLTL